jgi:NAD(P)H-hydrate epimerase
MENAGRAAAEEALRVIGKNKKRVAVFCGRGNNGGDGICAARHLLAAGVSPDIYLAGRIKEVKNEARFNLDIWTKLGKGVFEVNQKNLNAARRKISKYGLIIDALLGVGVKGKVSGITAQLIGLINRSPAYILSVDIPSGLDATSGRILGCGVRADKTVTFVAKKIGMVKASGRKVCGKIKVCDIGIPLLNRRDHV